jgi:IS30 family transposase
MRTTLDSALTGTPLTRSKVNGRLRSTRPPPTATARLQPATIRVSVTAALISRWAIIIGKDQGSAIATLVERQTRTVRLLHVPYRGSDTLHDALRTRMADLPPALLRSITRDQGTEMARHRAITRPLGAPVYFCDSHSPWQRGSNENMNGLLRDYFPKATDLSTHSPQHLLAVENELNNRPRRTLDDRALAELFAALLTSGNPSVLRR